MSTYPLQRHTSLAPGRSFNLAPTRSAPNRERFVLYLVGFQICCQLALLFSSIGALRVPVRVGSFAISLAFLFLSGKNRFTHPASKALWVAFLLITLSFLHPSLNSFPAGIAQICLNLAIMAPAFWVPRLGTDFRTLKKVILFMWCFHTASAALGVLQVEFPGRFQPALSTSIQAMGDNVDGLYITTNTGVRVFRPMGLTDQPGGAALSAFYAFVFGLGLFLSRRRPAIRFVAVASMGIGCTCLYLSQIRSLLIVAVVASFTVFALLVKRGEGKKVAQVLTVLILVAAMGLAWAIALARGSVLERLESLRHSSPTDLYHSNRGIFLDTTINVLLPQFPLGAGLGRWGMVNGYFGDHSKNDAIWVEIQWTAWLLDGGVPLIVAYSLALLLAIWTTLRIASSKTNSGLWLWGTFICAYDIAAVATTFDYPIFISQTGLEFWLINALLFAAWRAPKPRKMIAR